MRVEVGKHHGKGYAPVKTNVGNIQDKFAYWLLYAFL